MILKIRRNTPLGRWMSTKNPEKTNRIVDMVSMDHRD